MVFLAQLWSALVLALAMMWDVGWSLALGFALSGLVHAVVSPAAIRSRLGKSGPREIALATAFGAASSSCSYAAAALARRIFAKGASLAASLAFMFASTNLVVELGLVLFVLMGWQFTAAEWLGGLVLVAIMAPIVRLTATPAFIERSRAHARGAGGADDDAVAPGTSLWQRLRDPQTRVRAARAAASDFSMLRTDLIAGFAIAAALGTFVPTGWWHTLFTALAIPAAAAPAAALVGIALAMITFVCSIGNVPMAALLWGAGMPFAGVLGFLYADLLVIPLLDVYRKYYGGRTTAYIVAVFAVTIVASATLVSGAFSALHLVPPQPATLRAAIEHVSLNGTLVLNVLAIALVGYIVMLLRRDPGAAAPPACCGEIATTPASGAAVASTPPCCGEIATTPASGAAVASASPCCGEIATTPASGAAVASASPCCGEIATTPASGAAVASTSPCCGEIATTPASGAAMLSASPCCGEIATTPASGVAAASASPCCGEIATTPASGAAAASAPPCCGEIATKPASGVAAASRR